MSRGALGTKYDLERIELSESGSDSLAYFLVTAFLGGVLLNVMPCVLPVIGLKIMSFVQQAGESRAHAWALNIWYSAGIVAVFWGLAGLAAAFGMGWGTQNANDGFNLVLIGIVFAMALSLIGVWEIPIPGFVGSGAALELAEREGRSAAFLKGVLTTLLATPCTGPFMATALAWAVRQSAWVTFSVFTALGLGMAAPYLLIGAFPELIRFLPKPGMWMETFKKIMGLILMATVVWLLSFLDPPLLVPAAAFLVALTGICGWMARTPATAPWGQRAASWATAVLATLIAAQLCYGMLYPRVMRPRYEQRLEAHARARLAEELSALTAQLREVPGPAELDALIRRVESDLAAGADAPWQPFSLEQLGKLTLQDRRTVLVDFTADWCATCKSLEKLVLKTADVERALASADVATMVADYTEAPDWLTETLGALDSNGVPVIAIFPAHQPYRPIVFRGGYTKSALLEAIAAATGQRAVSRRPSAAR
jgi:thiol:disulfide interchange protein DsbD